MTQVNAEMKQFVDDVEELLSLNDSITKRLDSDFGWTPEAATAHGRDLDDRALLVHSLRASILRLRAGNQESP